MWRMVDHPGPGVAGWSPAWVTALSVRSLVLLLEGSLQRLEASLGLSGATTLGS
jgi:hypothetical protein